MANLESTNSKNVEVITLNHKHANCLSIELLNFLESKLDEIEDNSLITSIVLKSANLSVFSSGADLNVYKNARKQSEIADYLTRLGMLLLRLILYPKNVIAIVNGKSVGGALGLIAASDYVIASEKALSKLPELTLGIAPSIISPFLRYKIGVANLKTLSFGADWVFAERLLQFGLYSEIVASDDIEGRIEALEAQFGNREVQPIAKYKASFYPDKNELSRNIESLAKDNASWIWLAKEKGLFS